MADQSFPLPSSSYDELIKIIQGYKAVGKPATLSDVGSRIGIADTTISSNNRFLVAIGIIDGGQKKSITENGEELAQAIQYGMTEQIAANWRNVIAEDEFFDKVVSAVRIRSGMEPSALESHVAYTAGQSRTGKTMTGARAVVDILRTAGILGERDGKLVVISSSDENREPIYYRSSQETEPEPLPTVAKPTLSVTGATQGLTIHVEVSVQAKVDELGLLGIRLKELIRSLDDPEDGD